MATDRGAGIGPFREGCCDDTRKPCPYHEGWQDGVEHYVENVLGPPVTMDELREAIERGPDA